MLLAIIILVSFNLLISLFAIFLFLSYKINDLKEKIQQIDKKFEDVSEKDINIFTEGIKQSWIHVNISLYKMYTELDILDFDTLQSKLQQTLEEFAKDNIEMQKWFVKFQEYMKEREK